MTKTVKIDIAKDFHDAPGGRYKKDGKWSGEEFRDTFLEPALIDDACNTIEVILDGTFGYGISFLEEAFGGLARKYGAKKVLDKLVFVSKENPSLIGRIEAYVKEAEE